MRYKFNVCFDQNDVGVVYVRKEGLYYQISCRCTFLPNKLFRLQAVCEFGVIDLGICVPFADGFGIETKVPVKYFDVQNLSFQLVAKRENEKFIPLDMGKPFEQLDCLMKARFMRKDGIPCVVIKEN